MLPQVIPKLAVNFDKLGNSELQLTLHVKGDFFRVHRGSSDNPKSLLNSRKITFVYYFYRQPKQFTGGDLLLFDTNKVENTYTYV